MADPSFPPSRFHYALSPAKVLKRVQRLNLTICVNEVTNDEKYINKYVHIGLEK